MIFHVLSIFDAGQHSPGNACKKLQAVASSAIDLPFKNYSIDVYGEDAECQGHRL